MSTIITGVKNAVQATNKYFHELQNIIRNSLSIDSSTLIRNLRLEEVKLSTDCSQWLITLGYSISEDRQ
jgi:hypothetical protein